jgi:hypothetical protein
VLLHGGQNLRLLPLHNLSRRLHTLQPGKHLLQPRRRAAAGAAGVHGCRHGRLCRGGGEAAGGNAGWGQGGGSAVLRQASSTCGHRGACQACCAAAQMPPQGSLRCLCPAGVAAGLCAPAGRSAQRLCRRRRRHLQNQHVLLRVAAAAADADALRLL